MSAEPEESAMVDHLPTPEFMTINGRSIRLARGGATEGVPILLTSPWPESIYAFRKIWPKLAELGPLIAVDLPGFGRSEAGPSDLTPQGMGTFYVRLLDELGLGTCHVVAPDVGTAASLFAAASAPDLFATLTVGSGATDMSLVGDRLRQIIEGPEEAINPGDDAAPVVEVIKALIETQPPQEVMEDYRLSSADGRYIEAAAYVRAYPKDLPMLQGIAESIRTPVLVLSGRTDPLVPPANGDLLERILPNCRHLILESGHFVWEDAADDYARHVASWIASNGASA
ncbi:alpha/beta fold hydrolase [Sphingomonas sp. S2-65]|uniref:alpha/beta fold hydrolase n=1 Tax=Sphingomonas sp. S2-65 TaxID=2903960 RepID=UPI001F182C21|nr:alpha/beta hydrolase [Sphingomonas sp. S2-65]UYY58080.1 alpha/beta hydrolase [Sphingomonas sp. S2-65]